MELVLSCRTPSWSSASLPPDAHDEMRRIGRNPVDLRRHIGDPCTIVRCEAEDLRVRFHTHDEIGAETEFNIDHQTEATLRDIMRD